MIDKEEASILLPILEAMEASEEKISYPIKRLPNGEILLGERPVWEDSLNSINRFFEEGKYLQMWQAALMTMQGLKQRGVKTDWDRIEQLAEGIATSYYPDGTLHVKIIIKGGMANGLREEYDNDGKLERQELWINDEPLR